MIRTPASSSSSEAPPPPLTVTVFSFSGPQMLATALRTAPPQISPAHCAACNMPLDGCTVFQLCLAAVCHVMWHVITFGVIVAFTARLAAVCHVMERDYIRCHCRIHRSLACALSLSSSASLSLDPAMLASLALAPGWNKVFLFYYVSLRKALRAVIRMHAGQVKSGLGRGARDSVGS